MTTQHRVACGDTALGPTDAAPGAVTPSFSGAAAPTRVSTRRAAEHRFTGRILDQRDFHPGSEATVVTFESLDGLARRLAGDPSWSWQAHNVTSQADTATVRFCDADCQPVALVEVPRAAFDRVRTA
jgi:hypothetical protein